MFSAVLRPKTEPIVTASLKKKKRSVSIPLSSSEYPWNEVFRGPEGEWFQFSANVMLDTHLEWGPIVKIFPKNLTQSTQLS